MRVAFVAWRDLVHRQAGGSEMVVDRLLCGLADRGHEVALMCGGPVAEHEYPAFDIGGTYTQYLRAPLTHARHFRRFDVLVDVENGIPYFSPWWRRAPSVCLVHHVHTAQWRMRFGPVRARVGRTLESRVMPRAYGNSLFVAVSPSTAASIADLGVDPGRIRAICAGVDTPGPALPETPEPQFVALGRLVAHKRIDLLLRAWRRVRPVTGGRLVIAGDGPDREALQRGAPPGTIFAGRIDEEEKARLLAESWFLVHGAAHEGWGIVVMEAATVGRTTLAFDVPGIRDAILNGLTGILARDEDEFVAEWLGLASDHHRRAQLGGTARARSASCTWERTVEEFEAVVLEAAGPDAPKRTPTLGPAPAPEAVPERQPE